MSEILAISRFSVPEHRLAGYEEMSAAFSVRVNTHPGSRGTHIWVGVDDAAHWMRLTLYANEQAERHVHGRVSTSDSMVEKIREAGIVPDLTRCVVVWKHGVSPERLPIEPFVSYSVRAFATGMQTDWIEKLQSNFEEISNIDGYRGSMIATTAETPEEVSALVFWESEEAFRRSLPDGPDYEIDLYRDSNLLTPAPEIESSPESSAPDSDHD